MRTVLTCCAALGLRWADAQTTYEVAVTDSAFDPSYLSIQLGDHVHIVWHTDTIPDHTFTQVERATWEVDGTTRLSGGYLLRPGTPSEGRDFLITPTTDVWYVSRSTNRMKGLIVVEGGTGTEEMAGPHEVRFAPNPANGQTQLVVPEGWPVTVRILDRTGTQVMLRPLFTGRTLDISNLTPGLYLAEVWYMDGPLLGRKRLLVER